MTGRRPSLYWRLCWKLVSPCFLLVRHVQLVLSSPTCRLHLLQRAPGPKEQAGAAWCPWSAGGFLLPGTSEVMHA